MTPFYRPDVNCFPFVDDQNRIGVKVEIDNRRGVTWTYDMFYNSGNMPPDYFTPVDLWLKTPETSA